MLVSGGQILAIDRVYTDKYTISGDGVQHPLGVKTEVIATTALVSDTSAKLQSEIDTVSGKFNYYYPTSATSGAQQLEEAFDKFKTTQTIVSAGKNVGVHSAYNEAGAIVYTVSADDVVQREIKIIGTNGVSAKYDNAASAWNVGVSANYVTTDKLDDYYNKNTVDRMFDNTSAWAKDTFLSASVIDNYYPKSATSGKDEIQTALDKKQNKTDMSAYALSAWVDEHYQPAGDYVTPEELETALEPYAQTDWVTGQLNAKVDTSAMSAYAQSAWVDEHYQTKGKYVTSADDSLAGKQLVLKDNTWTELEETDWTDKIAEASAAAVQSAVNTVKNKFDLTEDETISGYDGVPFYRQSLEDYATKEYVDNQVEEVSSWADNTFLKKGNYLSADALNDVSGKWNDAYNIVNEYSAYWNEVSAFSANSGMFLTPEGVTDPGLAYFLKKDEETSKIAWSGVDLSNLGKMYGISSLSDNLYAGISADPETNEQFYVVSAASAETVALPDISGSGVSAWKDDEQNKYFVSANIVGNRGVSAGYDTDTNTWNVGISANDYAYYSNTYENNAGESVDTDTIIKFVGGIARGISVDADGYITLPDNGNKFTVCVNETVSDNIDSNAHAYLSNRIQLCSIRSDSAETVLVSTNNYYATEVGASDATIAYTLTNSPNTKYFIKYAGSKIDVSKNANAKLHIVISILEEVLSLSNTEGGGERYTGIEPIYVEDVSNKIGLAFDREQFQIVPGKDPDHPSLSALQINIQTTGGNIDQEAFEKLANVINGRMTETIPFGALNNEANLAGAHQYAYIFRPPMEYEMTSATQAYMFGGNGDGYISVAVYEGKSSNSNLIWQSNYTQLPGSNGGEVVMDYLNNAPTGTITPNSLYYVAVRIHKSDGGAGSWSYVLGTLMHERTTSVGQLVPWCGVGGISTLNFPSTYSFTGDSMSEFGSHKPYVGFRTKQY